MSPTNWLRRATLTAAACTLMSACTLPVTSDVNRAVIASVQCHTYNWAGSFRGSSPLRSTVANPINEQRLRAAIATQLQARGVQLSPRPDCLVGYGIGTRNVVEGAYPYGWGWGWGWGPGWGAGWGGPWGPWGWDYPYVYTQVIVAVDLFVASTDQPLWHAYVPVSSGALTGASAEQNIGTAVAAIFQKYPYQPAPTSAPPPTSAPAPQP